ncbi:deoxynucleotidyltransferase terminal-interacting protein 2 [Discoglossus pictus]
MVATRRIMRTEPHEEEDGSAAQATTEASASQVQTRNTVKSEDMGDNKPKGAESTVMDVDTNLTELQKSSNKPITRSRRISGQSEGDISEAESNCSSHSTRVTRSRLSLTNLTESARKLRNRTIVVTEPILESKEDSEISETESNCSSISTRAKRNQANTTSSSRTLRSRKSTLISEATPSEKEEDISEAESNCSSVSGVKIMRQTRATRSRASVPVCPPPPVRESQKEEVSDAESCSSGISANPIARRVSRRILSKIGPEEESDNKTSGESSQELSASRKPRTSLRGVTVTERLRSDESSETEQKSFSPPRRSVRNRKISVSEDAQATSVAEQESLEQTKENVIKESVAEEEILKVQETEEKQIIILSDEESLDAAPSATLEFQPVKTKDVPEEMDISEDKKNSDNSSEETMNVQQQPDMSSSESKEPACTIIEDSESKDSEDVSNHVDIVVPPSSKDLSTDKSEIVCKKSDVGIISLPTDSEESEDSDHDNDEHDETDEEEVEEVTQTEDTNCSKQNRKQKINSLELPADGTGDGLFVIDTAPGLDSGKKYYVDDKEDAAEIGEEESEEEEEGEPSQPVDEEDDFIDEEDEDAELLNKPKQGFVLSTSIDTGINIKDMGGLYISFDAEKPKAGPSLLKKMKENRNKEEILKKSIITPDFEKKESVPPYRESVNKLKRMRKEEKEKTTGQGWFDMKAPEMTEELKNDLKALKMRSAMDPKRFYKKNDRDGFPKYFQVGTIVDNPVDFFHSRIPKKERKRTIVEELLADAEFRRYNKRKYQEIIAEKAAVAEGKKNRKKKKFKK